MPQTRVGLPESETWVIRVYTASSRYRLQLSPLDNYQKVLDLIIQKTGYDAATLQVCNSNGKKLNIQPERRLKDVVYLNHGAILYVKEKEELKNSAYKSRASFLSADSKTNDKMDQSPPKKPYSPQKSKCSHPENVRCLHCMAYHSKIQNQTAGISTSKQHDKKQLLSKCEHGPNMKCLKCLDRPAKSPGKGVENQNMLPLNTPIKNAINNPEDAVTKCKHSSKITCPKCTPTPQKITKITLVNPQKSPNTSKRQSIVSPNSHNSPKQQPKPKQAKKCNHGPMGKCLNCLSSQKNQQKAEPSQVCGHGPNAKCINCLEKQGGKGAHLPFDQYLNTRHLNCQHSKENTCPNCLPLKNLRLTIDKKCKNHAPYPQSLCTSCMPQNVSIRRQPYRHVDYVQFMNNRQIQNFIDYWLKQKGKSEMRVGFLYGYYAEDPYYRNGIRAVVQALYQPHQKCTDKLFWITDTLERRSHLQIIIDSLGLEKIGMVITTNNPETPFNDAYIRYLARMQEEAAVTHSSGYRLSNMFTMVIGEKNSNGVSTIEPQIYMVSDQVQALETAGLFLSNKQNPQKMKIKQQTPSGELLPSVYLNGKQVNEFQIEFALVKIATGRDKDSKFAIMKHNQFPTSSRGTVKGRVLKEFIVRARKRPSKARFGDLNLLIFIAQSLGLDTAIEIARRVREQKEIQEEVWILVEKELSKYI